MSDPDLVLAGDDLAWLQPSTELRFVERDGKRILQQKWSAAGKERGYGDVMTVTVWRWRDVPLDLNPERDCAISADT